LAVIVALVHSVPVKIRPNPICSKDADHRDHITACARYRNLAGR